MPEVRITSVDRKGAKKWVRFSHRPPLSSQRFEDRLPFTGYQQRRTKKFLAVMDDCSLRSARFRRKKNSKGLKSVNKSAMNHLLRNGRSLFKILKKVKSRSVRIFEDLFGEWLGEVISSLDEQTRRFPWELAYDGEDFLGLKYSVGRIAFNPPAERLSGLKPRTRYALVVGLNYKWLPKKKRLLTPESEALQVERRLEKLGYRSTVLRGKEACKKDVKKALSEDISVFHFSGHGCFMRNQPEGKKGRLLLSDGDLNEHEMKTCFSKAKGAPYLSFLNACQSAKEIYNSHLVDAFLDQGAENIVGTMWSVYDQPSREMAIRFYDRVVKGDTFGEALQNARWHLSISRKHEEAVTWPALVLYGTPSNILPRAP